MLPGGFVTNCNGKKAAIVCPALYILNNSRNHYRGMMMVLAHEISHYIDNEKSNGVDRVFSETYDKMIACSHDTSKENIADYWSIETTGAMLNEEQSPAEVFSSLKQAFHVLCETSGGGQHSSGYRRIGDFLRNNPNIKRLMKCNSVSPAWEPWRENEYEEKSACTPSGQEF